MKNNTDDLSKTELNLPFGTGYNLKQNSKFPNVQINGISFDSATQDSINLSNLFNITLPKIRN